MHADEWTLAEGCADAARFLAKRAPWAALFAAAVFVGSAWAVNGVGMGEGIGPYTLLVALVAAGAGFPVGMIMSRGLIKAVHFVGWIPILFAAAATVAVLLATAGVTSLVLAFDTAFERALVTVAMTIGALAAVMKSTWADA